MDRCEFADLLDYYGHSYSFNALAECLGVKVEDIIRFFEGYDICQGHYQMAADQLAAMNVREKQDAK